MKLFSSLMLSLCSVWIFSQTILYQAESTSRTVQDPQTIVLAQGFHAKSDVSNPFIAKIGPATENPGGGPTDSQAGINNPSGTSAPAGQSFHDTKGEIEVNGAGQLLFTLPVALPPGIKNVAPQISLAYTSGSGNGIAGYGWNISGLTAISRIGKTIDKDGEVSGIKVDYSDYYSFNGQRLILKSGEYGKDGAEYVTEKYSNIKIRSLGMARYGNQPLQRPATFEVTFEDGSMAWYGVPPDSKAPFPFDDAITSLEYSITKWRDATGNYISYKYDRNITSSFISSIKWGGNDKIGTPHFNEIVFDYSNRNLKELHIANGYYIQQTKILNQITVLTNNNQFKRYAIEYAGNNTNYQFVKKITEFSAKDIAGKEEAANDIAFEYESDPLSNNLITQDSRFDDLYNTDISGDFNGDGRLDYIKANKIMLSRLDGNQNFYNISYAGKILSTGTDLKNNILSGRQLMFTGEVTDNNNKIIIRSYLFSEAIQNMEIVNTYTFDISSYTFQDGPSTVDMPLYPDYPPFTMHRTSSKTKYIALLEGDFLGRGVSDFYLRLSASQSYSYSDNIEGYQEREYGLGQRNLYLNLQKNILKEISIGPEYIADFNGDGKSDMLVIENDNINVYEINKTYDPVKILSTPKVTYKSVLYLGDFNGDGKTDIMAPVANESSDWRMYLSTGKDFRTIFYNNFFLYEPERNGKPTKLRNTLRSYFTPDINKDGKSDFIAFQSEVWFREWAINNRDSSYGFNYFRNEGVDADDKPIFSNPYNIASKEKTDAGLMEDEDINYSKYGEHYIPLLGSFRVAQFNTDFAIIHKTKLITWNLGSKLDVISKVKSITQAGIKTDIEYAKLTNEESIYKTYQNTSPVTYPYVNITENLNYNVVSRLTQGGRKQEFRYRDLIGHLNGRGMIGFRQTARSTFFTDTFSDTKVWSGAEIEPMNEGLPYKEWTIKTTDESKVFPADISLNNTQLLSFKQYSYKIDKLLNGTLVTAISDTDKPKVVTSINPHITISKDFLKNIKTVHTVEEYDNLYFPKRSVTNINNGLSISKSELEYYPPNTTPGNNFSIGKPKVKTEVVQAYGDTKSAKEEYVYNDNLLKTFKKWNRDNTGYLLETYDYDNLGNTIKKVISNSTDSQTQTTGYQYETQGRFVVKKTDNLGLETNFTYNDWGLLTQQIDPLGNILTNEYDHWGKLIESKSNTAGATTYEYVKDKDYNSTVVQYSPNGNISKTQTNKWGQEYKITSKAFGQGRYTSKDIGYDALGRKTVESEPYFEGQSATQWNVMNFDNSVYPPKITTVSANGKQTKTTVSGNTTIEEEINGNQRITSKTTDALGNIIFSTDKGGTIQFSYNATGEVVQAKYTENIVTTKYDSWGRKSEFNDPSNGLYKYEYDGFGQPKKIISPKGTKEYVYNNLGQIIFQKEISTADGGQTTDKLISYTYDNKGQVISKTGTSKGSPYYSSIAYDPLGRVLSLSESSNDKYFIQKGITYDDKARVVSYEKQLYSSGVLTRVTIENVYNAWNGEPYQIKDKTSGKILWQLNDTNVRGQATSVKLGEVNIINDYNVNNGFLKEIKHSSVTKSNFLNVKYTFDPIKNELSDRITLGDFNILESFKYDANNRLTSWTDPVTGNTVLNRNVYDEKGRILENDQLGKIKFENSAKVYQPTGMTLNAAGTQNYNNDLVQSIIYNENNDPVFIDGIKGDVAFQYGLSAMRQKATYGGNFDPAQEGKFTKFYSEDGSFEIVKNNITGQEKHLIYIGGIPYESNIVYLKNYTENNSSYKFLHKDYLGSILAISDEDGNKLEQRHFDAWGNFTHLQVGIGTVETDANKIKGIINTGGLLLERGYTSHEHFAEVGIIHMNGRLYDPLLKRFLNADENIQDPYNTQNYNKYGYVLNNPLMYNDPSGEFIWWIPAAVAVVSELFTMYYSQTPFDPLRFTSSLIMSYASAMVASQIGDVFKMASVIKSLGKMTMIVRAGAHAVAQGVLSFVQGGNFLSGALSGAFSSISNDLLDFALKDVDAGSILKSNGFALLNGAVSGGVGSVLGGGNFWMGAGQGLIVTAFNYLAHKTENGPKPKKSAYEQIKTVLDALGLNMATKEAILEFVSHADDLGKAGKQFKNIVGKAGKFLGFASAATAIADYIQTPTTAGILKMLVTSTSLAVSAVGTGGAATTFVGWALAFSDASGLSDFAYGTVGSAIDKYLYGGKSLGKAMYKSIENTIKPLINNQKFNFAH
ncbi:FG-GAP-like repeat-containing protein [Chryseobacterium sp. WG23]|uniref:RHS repeat-associated core domain-containing protein n=1 Tax=Chryseobacterium sp. WG23 TaxID=2926910 RepID=UPI00211E6EBB|nr:RHS repeat-associated core domain-containing protein [Chryseobacterium sp. WG23]MCQ9636451.1 FG-GAP-like repeat-containing protein [Chryseobacterium sp. WG23]